MTPDGWEQATLGDVAQLGSGRTPPRGQKDLFLHGSSEGIPWVKTMDLTDRWISRTDESLTDGGIKVGRLKINPPGTVLVAMYGGFQQIGRSGILQISAVTNQAICHIHLDRTRVYGPFCNYWLVGMRGRWRSIAASSRKDPNITMEDVRRFELLLPPLGEQVKISSILSAVDDLIEVTNAIVDQLQVVKTAMMAQLFSCGFPGAHTRFKQTTIGSVPEDWSVVPLDAVSSLQTGLPKGRKIGLGIELPYLRVANVQDGHVDLTEVKTIAVERSLADRYSLRAGDVLFTEGGDADKLGRGCVWHAQISPCLHQNHIFAVRADNGRLLPQFLAYWASSPRGKSYFLDCAKRTTNLASINSTQLRALSLPLPRIQEQARIVAAIESVDVRLECERGFSRHLAQTKSALMSVLLTGELRVIPDKAR